MIFALLLLGLLSPFQKVYRAAVPEHKIFGQALDPDNTCMIYIPHRPGQRVILRYKGREKRIREWRNPRFAKIVRDGWVQYYILDKDYCNLPDWEWTVK